MSARSMATGTISFGLVAIPIKLYSTSESSNSVSFSWLHPNCGSRVKQQYYCPVDEEIVPRNELVKGYQFSKDQYVIFTDEELQTLGVKATHSIDITEFLPVDQVDPIYFEKAYFLGPNKGGERPYRLLAEVMKETHRVALARYHARGKSYLVLLRPFETGLIMQQLRFAEDIRSFSEVPVGDVELKDQEIALAHQLVDQIASETFDPDEYVDEARRKLWSMIEQKVEGREITAPPSEEPKAQIIDLMEALKASLGDAGEDEEAPARKPPKRSSRSAAAKSGKKAQSKS